MSESPIFLAVDFETASASKRASACALGYALVVSGTIESAGQTLIDPGLEPELWSGVNIWIHGITPAAVRGAPKFMEAWEALIRIAPGIPIVAHNASFDTSVLLAEYQRVQAQVPAQRYACTVELARRAWPHVRSASLPNLAEMLGIELRHHDAGSDATACAQIAVAATRQLGADSLDLALSKAGLTWRQLGGSRIRVYNLHSQEAAAGAPAAVAKRAEHGPSHPLFGLTIVVTGRLESMSRGEAEERIAALGGKAGSSVTKQTDFLVVGAEAGSKLARAEKLGTPILDEEAFVRLLEGGPAALQTPSPNA